MNGQRTARGLTLIELLVAIALGAVLIAGAIRVFISNKDAYEYNNALVSIQSSGRVAMDMMLRDLRHAGHFGCSDTLEKVINATYTTADVTGSVVTAGQLRFMGLPRDDPKSANPGAFIGYPMEGYENANGTAVPSWLPSNFSWTPQVNEGGTLRSLVPVSGSDGFTVRYVHPTGNYRTVGAGGGVDSLVVTIEDTGVSSDADITRQLSDRGVFAGAMVGVSNCIRTHLFEIDTITPASTATPKTATIVSTSAFESGASSSGGYETDTSALIGRFVAVRFFVAGGRLDPQRPAGNTTMRIPTLYRERLVQVSGNLVARAEPLVEGVEDLQVLYGFDNQRDRDGDSSADEHDGKPDGYLTATGVNAYRPIGIPSDASYRLVNWTNVINVRIALLVRSIATVGGDSTPAQPDETFAALARFRDPTDADASVSFVCSDTSDACRYRRRVFVGTAAARNL